MTQSISRLTAALIFGALVGASLGASGAESLNRKYKQARQNLNTEKKARDQALAAYNKLPPEMQKLQEQITQTRLSLQQAQNADAKGAKAEQLAIDTNPKLVAAMEKTRQAELAYKEVENRAVDSLLHSAAYEAADAKKRQAMRKTTLEGGECLQARLKLQEASRALDDARDQITRAYRAEHPAPESQKDWRARLAELEKKLGELRRQAERHKAVYQQHAAAADKYAEDVNRIEKTAAASKIKLDGGTTASTTPKKK